MRTTLFALVLALVACGGTAGSTDDGGTPPRDGAPPPRDGAPPPHDGAVGTDAGPMPLPDGGVISPGVFPADRLVPWRGNVGVEGGIPTRTTLRNCVTSDSVPTDGDSDATSAIQHCLDSAPDEGVAYLPAGSYRITDTIRVPAHRTLRGDGPTAAGGTTIFTRDSMDDLLYVGAGYSDVGPLLSITAGHDKGSDTLTLADASSLSAGDYVLLNELNDPTIPVTPVSYSGDVCTWCDQFGATRLRAQVAKVVSRTGNEIRIAPPLFFSFSDANDPSAMRLNAFVEGAGIEDLVVKNDASVGTGDTNNNIMFEGAANSWARNVKVDTCGKRCVDLRTYYYRIEVRDSVVEGCLDHDNSDTCYGTELAEGSSSLVENNVYHDVSDAPMIMWGASGNVIGYNYATGVFRTRDRDSWFWPNSWSHGAHPSYNLWEGNVLSGINWDDTWGSASHNVAFRNRLTSHTPDAGLVPGHVEDAAILIETDNHYETVVGNVLGEEGWSNAYEQRATRYWEENLVFAIGTGADIEDTRCFTTLFRHQNYDFATHSVHQCDGAAEPGCQGGDGTTTLPPSLYLTDVPAWFGSVPFPPIDPAAPTATEIPAQRRWGS